MKMEDIARLAGVSKASVSRVLNNKPNVSPALKEKVEAVIKEYSYTPNLLAQALNTKATKSIGVLLPAIGLDVFSSITDGISQVLSKEGYELLLADSGGNLDKCKNYLEVFKKKQVDGILYFPTQLPDDHVAYINSLKIPIVLMGQTHPDLEKPAVYFSDRDAAIDIVNALVATGHKKIAYISMPKDHDIGKMRLDGVKTAVIENGIEAYVVYAEDLSYEAGYQAMSQIISRDITAIFAAMDRIAIGAMRYIQDQGLTIPDDYSVIGIDDMEISKMLNPRLSTILFDYKKSGKRAGEMILSVIENEDVRSELLEHEFKRRESVKEV